MVHIYLTMRGSDLQVEWGVGGGFGGREGVECMICTSH